MKRRTLLAGTAALAAAPLLRVPAQAQAAKTKIVWWHAMTAANADQVNHIAETFNQSQAAIEVQAIYKGGYPDVLNETIAASRAAIARLMAEVRSQLCGLLGVKRSHTSGYQPRPVVSARSISSR